MPSLLAVFRNGLLACVAAAVVTTTAPGTALAARPRNPYSSFNLSGINYGAMQWERAQRQGRRVEPRKARGAGLSGPGA